MADTSGYGSFYDAYQQAFGIWNDKLPTTDADQMKVAYLFDKAAADYAKSKNLEQLKRDTSMISAMLKQVAQAQSYHAKLAETQGKNGRVTAQVMTDRINNINDNMTRIAGQRSKFREEYFTDARAALDRGDVSGAWETLFRTLTDKGARAVGNEPESVPLAAQLVSLTMGGKNLSDVDANAVADRAGGTTELKNRIRSFVQEAQQKDVEITNTVSMLKKANDALIVARSKISADRPVDPTLLEEAQKASAEAQEVIKSMATETPEQLSQRLEDLRAMDSQYQGLLKRAEDAHRLAVTPGKEGAHGKVGRVIANPDFQAWAKDNGFDNLGMARVDENGKVYYTAGKDDIRALARFAFQLKHPNRQGPFLAGRGSGQLVTITATDPALRERILTEYKLANGQYAIDPRDPEGKRLLSPQEYEKELLVTGTTPSGYMYVISGNKDYVTNGTDFYQYDETSKTFKPVESTPELQQAAKNPVGPAAVYAKNDKGESVVQRYFTAADLDDARAAQMESFGAVTDEQERADIIKNSPVRTVAADQIKNLGEVQVTGFRDKMHAGTEMRYGTGAISLNNGQFVVTRGAKVEVREEGKPDLIAMGARALPGQLGREATAARAEARDKRLVKEALSPDAVSKIPGVEKPVTPPPDVTITPLDVKAAQSQQPGARAQALGALDVGSPAGTTAALLAGAEEAAAATAPATTAPAATTGAAAAPTAPAAPAPKAPATPAPTTAATSTSPTSTAPAPTAPPVTYAPPTREGDVRVAQPTLPTPAIETGVLGTETRTFQQTGQERKPLFEKLKAKREEARRFGGAPDVGAEKERRKKQEGSELPENAEPPKKKSVPPREAAAKTASYKQIPSPSLEGVGEGVPEQAQTAAGRKTIAERRAAELGEPGSRGGALATQQQEQYEEIQQKAQQQKRSQVKPDDASAQLEKDVSANPLAMTRRFLREAYPSPRTT